MVWGRYKKIFSELGITDGKDKMELVKLLAERCFVGARGLQQQWSTPIYLPMAHMFPTSGNVVPEFPQCIQPV